MTATGPIATFGAITAGAAYANGTYPGVALTGGSGSSAVATITVAGNAVTVVAFSNPSAHQQLDRTGKNYQVGDSLSALPSFDGVGSGSGFAVAVATLAKACENCIYGKIVPLSEADNVAGLRYCGYDAFVNKQAPQANFQPGIVTPWLSNITSDDYWCGDGADLATGTSFSSTVTAVPRVQGSYYTGFFTATAGIHSMTINDTRAGQQSIIVLFPSNASAAAFLQAHGLYTTSLDVGFSFVSGDATNFAGTEIFHYLGG
jgi:hypothetical protein